VCKAKWVRAVDLSLPSPPSKRSGRFRKQQERVEIETLDVGNAQRPSNTNGRAADARSFSRRGSGERFPLCGQASLLPFH
jgi:hypothetical protein